MAGERLMIDILMAARALRAELVETRREIHRHPELMYQERRTAALVADRLTALGIEHRKGVGGTGVVGVIRGGRPGKTVLLRADMDALPIDEATGLPFASETPGLMHACGHDGHTAMLLGAAKLLATRRDEIAGNVVLMFQPAEEGGAGAKRMIEEGVLANPSVDAAFALHVDGERPVGMIGVRPGFIAAAADHFEIEVQGRGGHAAFPHAAVDPIVVASHLVIAIQTILSREVSPLDSAVVTVANVSAGLAANVIPETARLIGTVRTASEPVRDHIEARLRELASGIAGGMRASADVTYIRGYPAVINDAAMTTVVEQSAIELLGRDGLCRPDPLMGSEDFAFVLQRVPGAFFLLGVRDPAWREPKMVHSSAFDLNEDALPIGTAMLASCALRFLAATPEPEKSRSRRPVTSPILLQT
jgi:amidohydrolase